LNSYNRLYLTLTEAAQKNKNDLENLVIANNQKRVIRLKDLAKIEVGSGAKPAFQYQDVRREAL
jgi:Cu/Ag efflux pump CusA